MNTTKYPEVHLGQGLELADNPFYKEILSDEALAFLRDLHRQFNHRRKDLLEKRIARQKHYDQGQLPDFLPETAHIRQESWTIAPIPAEIQDRRVEITGPVDRKMVINALNAGAKVFMADFEDSNSPTLANCLEGQINLRDAIRKTIEYVNPGNGRQYRLNEKTAVLFVRPRGWHLVERHLLVDGEEISGSLFDFGLYFFHNANEIIAKGSAPYFYLPKMESHLEARLWNDVFVFAQHRLGISKGTIKATVLIETLPAAFEMDEILWELKDHSCGLNCGRWDYIFSFIKKLSSNPSYILPDRSVVTMDSAFLDAYSKLLIKTCHRRGAHAMGGMAAQIPIKNDEQANKTAFGKVYADKLREAMNGHDGTWVAHPGLVATALEVFDEYMPKPNQINEEPKGYEVSQADLLKVHGGNITEAGLRENVNVGILYIENWLRGNGAAAIYHKMEDAATAEISRAQVWQWLRHSAKTNQGKPVSREWVEAIIPEELEAIKGYVGDEAFINGRFPEAVEIFRKLVFSETFLDFLTLEAYRRI